MARRGGFISTLNSIARETARQQRRLEAEQRRQQRAHQQLLRQLDRDQRLAAKEEKQRYLDQRQEETEDSNIELAEQIDSLKGILEYRLSSKEKLGFDLLRTRMPFVCKSVPPSLATPRQRPHKDTSQIKLPGLIEKFFGGKARYEQELADAETSYKRALAEYERSEKEREKKLAEFKATQEKARNEHEINVAEQNREVEELENAYKAGDEDAIVSFISLLLDRSEYPEDFPQDFRVAYSCNSRQLVIDYDLPPVDIVPTEAEFRYVKTKDTIEAKPRKAADIKELYQDVIASTCLRTMYEIFEADDSINIDVIVFNGFVNATDPTNGQDVHPCILSVRATREQFATINLDRVEKRACLRNLGAQVSSQPQALQPVKPIVEFDMFDKRFIEQGDVLSDLESRPNLMNLNPYEFENLVSNLFGKMGLESKLTRTSKDGGVDAVAYDTRPVIGGKVVIQAKRYKNTVGVSAVRDLYGTMLNEGANKGILVTTSGYGPDAFSFAKDKPIELIDGGGLLFLLDQVGINATIILPEDGV